MIQNIVIVGGGTAGWMTAAALSNSLDSKRYSIKLIESDQLGTVGVGEASIPPLKYFNGALGIDELDFIKATSGTFKLGIEFVNWRQIGHSYFHPFGEAGSDLVGVNFMQHWLRWRSLGHDVDLMSFNVEYCAAQENKFTLTSMERGQTKLPSVNYAYHFDATQYAKFLREYAEKRSCVRIEGKVVAVTQNSSSGNIQTVSLESGEILEGDFFIDCSGFKGLLIEETLKAGYNDWSHWLPVNSAIAAQTKTTGELLPYTRSIAKDAGWQWRIPLQHRVGNGYAYSNKFIDDDLARESFIEDLDGELLTEPKVLRFTTGSRKKSWVKNCVAIGLSSGFLEPLESTSIHLIQRSIHKLLAMFPVDTIDDRLVDRFNSEVSSEYSEVKDFLIAHYVVNERYDTEFWRYLKSVELPESLSQKIETFRRRGEVYVNMQDCFREISWFAVLNGQGLEPESYHPIADSVPEDALQRQLTNLRGMVKRRVESMPNHRDFINQLCKSDLL